jgi:glycosyltransferase involved in cell wall biosynthesis
MTVRISVLLSTHNPRMAVLQRTLDALARQTLPASEWELVLVDNGSLAPVAESNLLLGDVQVRHVRENQLGLLYGRLAGIRNSSGDIIVFCDDDTIFKHDYLEVACRIFGRDPLLGVAVGKSVPDFEVDPQPWVEEFFGNFGLWDHGNGRLSSRDLPAGEYPYFAGGGGGAVFRREALECFVRDIERLGHGGITGRAGKLLSSGEDNHIVLTLIENGWAAGYLPELFMTHVIPKGRIARQYVGRLNHGIARSWVQVLHRHGICPWTPVPAWTVPLRKARAFIRYHAWAGPSEYVRWRGACGQFEGRAAILTEPGVRR